MKPVWLDFVQPWPRHVRVLRYALLAVGILSLASVFYQYQQLADRSTALAWQLQNLQSPAPAASTRFADTQITDTTEAAAKRAGEVLQQLDLPWQALFSALESAVANEIVILSLLPDAQGGTLAVKALATDADAAIDFADRLKASRLLSDIHLVQEEPVEENERFPLQFSINADWNAGLLAAPRAKP